MAAPELRPGARVSWHLAQSDEDREGELMHASPNGEEWLVKHRFGRTWVSFRQLHVKDDASP